MTFEEYARRRGEYVDDDGHAPLALTFRIHPFPAFALPSLSRRRDSQTGGALYRYLTLVVEMGLIVFQHDYHEIYTEINSVVDSMVEHPIDDSKKYKWACQIMSANGIELETSSRTNKKFNPQVAYWLSSAIKQLSGDLKMTQSDLIVLCISLGIREDNKTKPIPSGVLAEFEDYISRFEYCIHAKLDQLKYIKNSNCGM
jgi:hypothetical protein